MLEADVEVDRRDFPVRARLAVAAGERLALFGPSGAGKTTLLEAIAGLIAPRRARITLGDRVLSSTERPATAVPPWQRRIGLLRQDPGLFPHLSVRGNLRYAGAPPEAEVRQIAVALGIDGLLDAMPARLSGGQAHRVALGRLLLARCDALLLDEPYTGLDASLRTTLTELVIGLVAQRGVPAILVAHELDQAQAFADRLAVLDRGAMLQEGAPGEVVLRPASQRVAELVGYGAFLPAGVPGATTGVHPDRVLLGRHPDLGMVLAGVVTACTPSGARWQVQLATVGGQVTGRLAEPATAGQRLVITAIAPPVFGADGRAVSAEPLGDGAVA